MIHIYEACNCDCFFDNESEDAIDEAKVSPEVSQLRGTEWLKQR